MDEQIQFYEPQENNTPPSAGSKKIILLVVIILIPFLTILFIGFKAFSDVRNQRQKTADFIKQQQENQQHDKQVIESSNFKGISHSDDIETCLKKCAALKESWCKNTCWTYEAKKKNDISFCSNITSGIDYCEKDVAIASKNPENCAKIGTYSNKISSLNKDFSIYDCYKKISMINNDTSICEKILKDFLRGRLYNDCVSKKDSSTTNAKTF